MKIIHVLILIVLLSVFAFGQSADRLLVSGDPPLMQSTVDQLIDFFEFGLHSKFSPAERAEFTAQRINEWKNGEQKSKDDAKALLDMRARLMGLDDAKLREAQATVQNYIVETIQKQPNDPTSKLLKEVYDNGLRNAVSSNRLSSETDSVGEVSADVSALLGTWQTGTVSGVGFVNQSTGSYTNGGGTQVLYTFKPGGRYEYGALTQSTMYNCTMKAMTFKTGIVQIRGGALTFIPQTSSFTSEDSCVARNNYKKPASMERETFNWSVQRDEYGTKLCLQNATINGCAYKH